MTAHEFGSERLFLATLRTIIHARLDALAQEGYFPWPGGDVKVGEFHETIDMAVQVLGVSSPDGVYRPLCGCFTYVTMALDFPRLRMIRTASSQGIENWATAEAHKAALSLRGEFRAHSNPGINKAEHALRSHRQTHLDADDNWIEPDPACQECDGLEAELRAAFAIFDDREEKS
jgi:hypothetical protein